MQSKVKELWFFLQFEWAMHSAILQWLCDKRFDRFSTSESDILAPPFWRRTIWRHRFGARTFGRRTVGHQENWAPDNWAQECKEQDREIIDYLHEIFQRLWVRPVLRTPKSSVKEIPITLPTSQSNEINIAFMLRVKWACVLLPSAKSSLRKNLERKTA